MVWSCYFHTTPMMCRMFWHMIVFPPVICPCGGVTRHSRSAHTFVLFPAQCVSLCMHAPHRTSYKHSAILGLFQHIFTQVLQEAGSAKLNRISGFSARRSEVRYKYYCTCYSVWLLTFPSCLEKAALTKVLFTDVEIPASWELSCLIPHRATSVHACLYNVMLSLHCVSAFWPD